MPPYAYKMKVEYCKGSIHTDKMKDFDSGCLTIEELTPIVGEHMFSVTEGEWGSCAVHWTETRKETDAEQAARIKRQEAYNAEVDRRRSIL